MYKLFQLLFFTFLVYSTNFSQKVPVPVNGCYHAAFVPGESGGHQGFENLAQKTLAIEMNFFSWSNVPDFPLSACNGIIQAGSTPHITWEPWNGNMNSTQFSNQAIISGNYDAFIARWAAAAKSFGKPLFLRWGHEMNGNWYPWDGTHSGGKTTTDFGDPAKADGPERYIAAYRHIYHIFDSLKVNNITWVWCPNYSSSPNEEWNKAESYYPGDDVVDWIGVDGYNFGTSQSWSSWTKFISIYNSFYNTFKPYGKPIMIGEYACTEVGGSKSQWITDAYTYTKLLFPQIKAITWFNINKETDWRINSSDLALQAYKKAIADPYFLGKIVTDVKQDNSLPLNYLVLSAFPNPFNPGTSISYNLPESSHVRLRIFDILGNQITILTDEIKAAGTHKVNFDASKFNLVSGVYLCCLQAGGKTTTFKIIFQK